MKKFKQFKKITEGKAKTVPVKAHLTKHGVYKPAHRRSKPS